MTQIPTVGYLLLHFGDGGENDFEVINKFVVSLNIS